MPDSLAELATLEFPRYPQDELSNTEVRSAYAKANAYVTLALIEAGINHSRSEEAAAVTDATHGLRECSDPEEYLNLAQQELAFVCAEMDGTRFGSEMERVWEQVAECC